MAGLLAIATTFGAALIGPAIAQEVNGPPEENPQPQVRPPTNVKPNGVDQPGALFDLTPLGAQLGSTLKNRGIYLNGSYTANLGSVVDGGRKEGTYEANQTTFGADFDLHRMYGLDGTSVHFLAVSREGVKDNRTFSGSSTEGFDINGPVTATRLTELTIDKSLFNDHLLLLAGRSPGAVEYATSDLYCNFLSGLCGNLTPYAWSSNSNAGFWPLATWTGRATIKPTASTYIRFGASEANPDEYLSHSSWPWNGGWDTSHATGVVIPLEIGYRTSFANDPYPRAFDVGAFYDTSTYSDPFYNTAGQSATRFGGTPLTHAGRASVYVQAQQMVWRPDLESHRGVTLFGAALFGVHGVEQIEDYFLAGLVDVGPFASRPNDTINFLSYTNVFDKRVTDDYAASLASTGQIGSPSRTETVFELNYGLLFAPGFQLKPFVQYIIHPDQIGFGPVVASDRHAVIVGAAFSIAFNDAFGLPAFVRSR
ncbi:carbohydrate porin [Beijerinckia sp. L45]|uniref:carbohydrate porin n=1 Tax=Beijerinckia sp. L45 TaxID=1641855 RepID=UPI00131CBE2C|nr:carbohydrate porin [Beijerinckia sp. L45]